MPNHMHLLINKHDNLDINISQYINVLKTFSSRDIKKTGLSNFKWQKSFFDHIVRDEDDYYNRIKYIRENPIKWAEDDENPKNN